MLVVRVASRDVVLTLNSRRYSITFIITTNMDFIRSGLEIATNPKHTQWIYPLLLIADAALCGVIIEKIPCS